MSGCALFPASSSRYRVWSMWADRESYLSLVGGTFTRILWLVTLCTDSIPWFALQRIALYVTVEGKNVGYKVTQNFPVGWGLSQLFGTFSLVEVQGFYRNLPDTWVSQQQSIAIKVLISKGSRFCTKPYLVFLSTPRGIRIPVTSVKGRCPRPLDDGGLFVSP